jgi:hypothetical protein
MPQGGSIYPGGGIADYGSFGPSLYPLLGDKNRGGPQGYDGGQNVNEGDLKTRKLLLNAKISPDAVELLTRERLLDIGLLRRLSPDDVISLGMPYGDRKRLEMLLSY